jgi:hypothetical protein
MRTLRGLCLWTFMHVPLVLSLGNCVVGSPVSSHIKSSAGCCWRATILIFLRHNHGVDGRMSLAEVPHCQKAILACLGLLKQALTKQARATVITGMTSWMMSYQMMSSAGYPAWECKAHDTWNWHGSGLSFHGPHCTPGFM